MNQVTYEPLDFEYWSELAKASPAAFEEERLAAIERLISNSHGQVQERLRCLQWRIDRTRERSRTPIGACVALSRMMWENYDTLNSLLQRLATPRNVNERPEGATILAFRRA